MAIERSPFHYPGSARSERKEFVTPKSSQAMLILVAGPYRSGTNDDPALITKNVEQMESYALPIFRAGHIPILGEWLALPLVELAGSRKIGDVAFTEIFHPIATRLLEKCDGVLRVGGPSAGRRNGPSWPQPWVDDLHHARRNPEVGMNENCAIEFMRHYPSQTHFPPTIVRSIGMLMMLEGSSLNTSRPRTTRSASLPASIEPFRFSSYEA